MSLQLTDIQIEASNNPKCPHLPSKEGDAFMEGYKEAAKKFQKGYRKAAKNFQKDMELFITEIDKTMVFSTMREGEIYDIQQIFRKYGYHYDDTLQRWAKRED